MSMIAKVAKAIEDNIAAALPDGFQMDYHYAAVAAIQAMREPTERMVSEMESAASFGIGRPVDDEAIPRVWTWAIDAALKEE